MLHASFACFARFPSLTSCLWLCRWLNYIRKSLCVSMACNTMPCKILQFYHLMLILYHSHASSLSSSFHSLPFSIYSDTSVCISCSTRLLSLHKAMCIATVCFKWGTFFFPCIIYLLFLLVKVAFLRLSLLIGTKALACCYVCENW